MVGAIERAFKSLLIRDRPAESLLASGDSGVHDTISFNEDTSYPLPHIVTTTNPASSSGDSMSKNSSGFDAQYTHVRAENDYYPGQEMGAKVDHLPRGIWNEWSREVFSIMCSLTSLAAIIIVLAKYVFPRTVFWQ